MTQENLMISIDVLRKEVEVLTSRLGPAGTGNLHTAINVINKRIDELIDEVTAPYWKDEDGDIGRLPGQTRASHLRSIEGALEEDVYDGFAEHTEAMEQARLRSIQDSAAGKPNAVRDAYLHSSRVKDDVEHTKEYYDTGRNRQSMDTLSAEALGSRPMEGEDLPITEGLSNRSMKRRYGHAVMTTSEMMQDELEPLPINTFE